MKTTEIELVPPWILMEDKKKEFSERIAFAAWESKIKGYNYFNEDFVLRVIKELNNGST